LTNPRLAAGGLEPGSERPDVEHFIGDDRLTDALDIARRQRPELKKSFGQLARLLTDDHRTRCRQRLQPRRQTGRMADRRVLDSRVISPDTAHHHLAGVYSHPHEQRQAARRAQRVRVMPDSALQFERRINRTLRIVSVCDRSAEQGEDSVTSRLHHASIETSNHLDHNLQRRIDQPARIFRIQRLEQIHRSLYVGEEHGDRFTFTVTDDRIPNRGCRRRRRRRLRAFPSQTTSAFAAELRRCRIPNAAVGASACQR
jgi:hypothetical protein